MTRRERLSATVDADLLAAGRLEVAAGRADSLSGWVNDALRLKAEHDGRLRALDEFIAAYEAEHGAITDEEMDGAARRSRGRAVVVRGSGTRGDAVEPYPARRMSLVFDAGALIAIERHDRDLLALVKRERRAGRAPITHGGVIGQVWRGGSGRQVVLARFLPAVEVRPLDDDLGRQAGTLLAATGDADVIDAAVVLLAVDGDDIYTSDPDDLYRLALAADRHVELVGV